MSERLIHHENKAERGEGAVLERVVESISALRKRAEGMPTSARHILLGGAVLLGLAATSEVHAEDRGNGVSFNAQARTEELALNIEDIEHELQLLRTRLERMGPRTPPIEIRETESRIRILEHQEAKAEMAMEKAAQRWTEQRATQPKKQIDVAERATDETNMLLTSWGIVVNKNILSIPVEPGLYREVILGPDIIDIGFPVRNTRELRIVLHRTNRTFNTIVVVRDVETGLGIFTKELENTNDRGYPLSQD